MSAQTELAIETLQAALAECSKPDSVLAHPGCPENLQGHMAESYRVGYLTGSVKAALRALGVEAQS